MWVRRIGGTLAGVVVTVLVVSLLEMAIHYVFPGPPTGEQTAIPATGLLLVIVAYGLGVLAGGLVAVTTARSGPWPAWVVGGVMAVSVISLVIFVPHPWWFTLLALAVVGGAAWFVGRRFGGPNPPATAI